MVRYNKILAQRNKLLKDENDINIIKETLPIWNSQLAEIGTDILIERNNFCEKMQGITEKIHNELTCGEERLELEYESKIDLAEREIMKNQFLDLLSKSLEKDIHLRYTTVGCHRDDINITINGVEVSKVCIPLIFSKSLDCLLLSSSLKTSSKIRIGFSKVSASKSSTSASFNDKAAVLF